MKSMIISLTMALSASLFADTLPAISGKCQQSVNTKGYCTETAVVNINVNPTNSIYAKGVKEAVKVFVYVEADFQKVKDQFDVESFEEGAQKLIDLYKNHKSWPAYAKNSGKGILVFKESRDLPVVDYVKDGVKYKAVPHVASYSLDTKIPLVGVEDTYEVAYNYDITPWTGALQSIAYEAIFDKGYPNKGVKHKSGTVHIAWDADREVYQLYSVNYVIPNINVLLSVAEAPIASGIEAILLGMLKDYLND